MILARNQRDRGKQIEKFVMCALLFSFLLNILVSLSTECTLSEKMVQVFAQFADVALFLSCISLQTKAHCHAFQLNTKSKVKGEYVSYCPKKYRNTQS